MTRTYFQSYSSLPSPFISSSPFVSSSLLSPFVSFFPTLFFSFNCFQLTDWYPCHPLQGRSYSHWRRVPGLQRRERGRFPLNGGVAEGLVRRCFQHPLAALQLLNLLTAPLVVDLKPSDDAILLWIGGTGFRGRQIADFGEEAVKEAHVVARGKPYVAFRFVLQPRGDIFECRHRAIRARRRGFYWSSKDVCSGDACSPDYWCGRPWNSYQLL